MKKNNKGFTLIELLAVIVVLAIIMVIATMAVNRQIKKARKDTNDINKEVIAKATKTCLVENAQEDCDTIEELQEKGYLEEFEDPWTGESENLDDSYIITINEDGTDAKVMYFGKGITEEVETPPEEYFSWCNGDNGKHKCTDGLTSEGKEWLQKHDDILIFPDSITTIKDCESNSKNCTNFSGVNIEALIATNEITISADFSDSTINVVRVDSGTIGKSRFRRSHIKRLILGNAGYLNVGESTFSGSSIDYFKIESGQLNWQAFTDNIIGTLEIGKDVDYIGGNLFSGSTINKLIFNSAKITSTKNFYQANSAFKAKIQEIEIGDNVTIILSKFFQVSIGNSTATLKKITIGKNVKTIEPRAFQRHINNGSGCGHGTHSNCLFTKINGTYITQEEYDTNPSYYSSQGYCRDIFCEISSIEEIVIKGDPNRFDDVWNEIPFPPKNTIKITTE